MIQKTINEVRISGKLLRDPEIKNGPTWKLAKLSLNVWSGKKNKQTGQWENEPIFIDATCFNQVADIEERFRAGDEVLVSGRLKMESWVNKEGQKRSKICITAESVGLHNERRENTKPVATFENDQDIPF